MNKEQELMINEKIKIYEALKILNEANKEIIKNEIYIDYNISLSKKRMLELTKKINVLKSVLLLSKGYFIRQIAEELNLSTSCIQRYLNCCIVDELGSDIKIEVENTLKHNLQKGKMLGSENYVLNNEAIKLENGKFSGSIKRMM